MNKVLAVALLDCRRLGFGLLSAALVAGLIPSLASGLGESAPPANILLLAFLVVGAAAGGFFGSDFADGRSSFFFGRPLSTWALIAGRFAGLLALAAAVFSAFMASYWLSSRGRIEFHPWILNPAHAEALGTGWALSLFLALAIAARSRGSVARGALQTFIIVPLRLALSLGAFLLVFGLFADLVLRAYFNDFRPIRFFYESWVAASFVACCVAIAGGRTERLRIARLQGLVMAAHFALVSVVVVTAWTYVLHPGPDAIRRVEYPSWGSSDGRSAYLSTKVDRGDGQTFRPVFIVDLASGRAQRLNSDPYQGPWLSADGAIMVWSEATPFFFRPLWRRMGGATTFRVKTASGEVTPLPMPSRAPDYTSVSDLSRFGAVNWVLPAPDGDVFAIQWEGHLSFTSRSRGELSDLDEGKKGSGISRGVNLPEAVFLPSGELRAARFLRDASGAQNLTFIDIDPKSGSVRTVASIPVEGPVRIQLDATAARALLTSITHPGRGAFISLVDLNNHPADARSTTLLKDVLFPSAIFLADGRIAATTGGSVGAWDRRALRIFSPTGQAVLDVPIGAGMAPRLGGEMFPGILAVSMSFYTDELSLFDVSSGAVVRRIPNVIASGRFRGTSAPPGTPAARLVESRDGKLFELASVAAEPRLLLPLPRP